MANKYDGLTFEKLAAHTDEGWNLANTRTVQLREAIEALRDAEHMILGWGKQLGKNAEENPNFQKLAQVLSWGKTMFPEPAESLHDQVEG